MNHLKQLTKQLTGLMFAFLLAGNLVMVIIFVLTSLIFNLPPLVIFGISVAGAFLLSWVVAVLFVHYFMEPIEAIWRAVVHLSKDSYDVAPPDLKSIRIGREMVTSLCMQIYDLASNGGALQSKEGGSSIGTLAYDVLGKFPLPVIVLSPQRTVIYVNEAASSYGKLEDPIGKSIGSIFNLAFHSADTLYTWLDTVADNRITDTNFWHHVTVRFPNETENRECDVAGYYNKDNPMGYETIVTLFDKTDAYAQETDGLDYVAVAVHELRTPLTIMRGYIEVFQEELGPQLTPELTDFMHKLAASAQQLTAFISNILNVARIDEGQYQPKLQKEDWNVLLPKICGELEMRAKLRGKRLEYDIAPGLPPVAVDRLSIYEVLANLIENAIKYSPSSDRIIIAAKLGKDGNVETTVQDFGIGMPPNVVPRLFQKFYRNHRSRAQVTGSGLGLYLVKSIVTAHGGTVSVDSHEGQGSTFGFSLKSYDHLADAQKIAGEQREITHQAHGWIKNHSMYRR